MRGFLWPALAGAAATCAGNGLARFAYVPLFPAMADTDVDRVCAAITSVIGDLQ